MKRMIRFVCVPLVWFCFLFKAGSADKRFHKKSWFHLCLDWLPGYCKGHSVSCKNSPGGRRGFAFGNREIKEALAYVLEQEEKADGQTYRSNRH